MCLRKHWMAQALVKKRDVGIDARRCCSMLDDAIREISVISYEKL